MAGDDPKPEHATSRLDRDKWTSSLLPGRPVAFDDRERMAVRRFTLLVVAGPDAGNRVVSTSERLVVGSHRSADLVLADPGVAPFHVEVALSGKLVVLRDLDTEGGTAIDGVAVRVAHLRGGSVIALGGSQVRFDTGSDVVAVRLSPREAFGALVGGSRAMRRAFAELERAASGEDPILLEGEPGTGKRTAAAALHAAGARRAGPLVIIDGEAGRLDPAALARAAGGTLVVHEVSALGPADQQQLLTWLDATKRVVATTTRALRTAVNAGTFSAELFARLARVEIRLPPLRERDDDLALLVGHLLGAFGAAGDGERLRAPEHLVELARRHFPGNVADLALYLARALVFMRGAEAPEQLQAGEDLAAARARHIRELDARVAGLLQSLPR